jgi:tRNA A-37 threonylcarbamoyl transferase component Bud32
MSGKVKLQVTDGPMKGKDFLFEEHDTFIFGRMPDCHACLPDDPLVSRHHFILEANPPDARIRDLGSLNGTHVNGAKFGSREKGETPEEGAKRKHPEVDLKDGDRIRVGDTILLIRLEGPGVCCQCNREIADADRQKCAWIGGTFICVSCKEKLAASAQPAKKPEPVRCKKCGKDVSAEVGQARRGDYVCQDCQKKAEADPLDILLQMLRQAAKERGAEGAPAFEGYQVEKPLGRGGMGVVYLARRKKDGRRLAIKVMLSKVAVDEQSRTQFEREMEVCRGLKHPNIVEFIEQGSAGSAFYFVMEFCDGGSVDNLMEQHGGKLPLDLARPIMLQLLEGLAYAHAKDIVHRDLKPQNILLSGSGADLTAKVSDFGLSKNFAKAGLSGHTMTGQYAGTPVFMPKEQVTNFKYVKPTSDVWSIGATFYNMLTGQLPRDIRHGQDPLEVVLTGAIVPIRKRDSSIPAKLAEVIDRALANDAKERFQDAGEMLKAIKKAM